MDGLFSDYSTFEKFYLICAIVGGIVLAVRLVLMFMGGDMDGADTDVSGMDIGDMDGVDIDAGHMDMGHDASDMTSADSSDFSFQVLSLQSLSAFFTMFGLVGLAITRQWQQSLALSLLGAFLAGSASVWIIGKMFEAAVRMQSSGTLNMRNAIGATGKVYLNIPEKGIGRVTVKFQSRVMELDAVSDDGLAIPTDTAIRVLDANESNMVTVERLHK